MRQPRYGIVAQKTAVSLAVKIFTCYAAGKSWAIIVALTVFGIRILELLSKKKDQWSIRVGFLIHYLFNRQTRSS